jgi:hypothetical protein
MSLRTTVDRALALACRLGRLGAMAAALAFPAGAGDDPPPVDFSREIQPLLAERCFKCHGPDEGARKSRLRLDLRETALAPAGSGGIAIVPGDVAASELALRIHAEDPDERMPPPSSGKLLNDAERALLARWIAEGAPWGTHWAWLPPVAAAPPQVENAAWCRNAIDRFVLARLEREGLAPSPPAEPVTLLRRVTLALTGLPPTPEEVDLFVAACAQGEGAADAAYERALDRLFESPHYGERMALPWLDAARYADSNGFQQDGDTYQWVWRDWLVRALNANVPFDRFATELLAGDLLPDATLDQQVASGFERCHLLNGEGGAIPEEQRNVIVVDRVDVMATTFLALTVACAQCHDHKYDPITQHDYYGLFAYFNQVPESGVPPGGGQYRIAEPFVVAGTPEQNARLAELERAASEADAAAARAADDPSVAAAQAAWELAQRATLDGIEVSPWQSRKPRAAASFDAAYDAATAEAFEAAPEEWSARPELEDGVPHELSGDATLFVFRRTLRCAAAAEVELGLGSDDALRAWLDGTLLVENKVTRGVAPDQEVARAQLAAGEHELRLAIVNGGGPGGFWFQARIGGVPLELAPALRTAAHARDEAARERVRAAFLARAAPPALAVALERQRTARAAADLLRAELPRVMVMSDAEPRATHVLQRGNYTLPLEKVGAAPPAFLPPPPADVPPNRLGLARWLVAPQNPLTARVQVNRAWQLFFGTGLALTSENFGVLGAAPSHPELLDWLAVDFREHGWDVKRLQREIVLSATFRQASRLDGARGALLRERDPENRLLARGPRRRLPSLLLRDVALAAGGLLVPTVGGPPVYPYQPAGIWDGLAITKERDFSYPESQGADLWRRSLYTFWRRTAAPGNMFDASARQTCQVRLPLTSTPLHALVLLNDPTWVEAGRALAERAMQASPELDARLVFAFRRVVARTPGPDELALLRRGFERALAVYRADPEAAVRYLAVGASPRDAALDRCEHAALASVCLTLLNLDEALTCE